MISLNRTSNIEMSIQQTSAIRYFTAVLDTLLSASLLKSNSHQFSEVVITSRYRNNGLDEGPCVSVALMFLFLLRRRDRHSYFLLSLYRYRLQVC